MSEIRRAVPADQLNAWVEFDVPFTVHVDGTVSLALSEHAPDLLDEHLSSGWTPITGYSGQHGYRGPIMHNSEFLGGRMASDTLAEPGTYVIVAAHWSALEDDGDTDIEGWMLARKDS
jgi:hypothetical protein